MFLNDIKKYLAFFFSKRDKEEIATKNLFKNNFLANWANHYILESCGMTNNLSKFNKVSIDKIYFYFNIEKIISYIQNRLQTDISYL
ncbi:MAG: hypothetical protein J6O88_13665 [Chryseobacterium sp.]|nr:hypothetical protein [Chryseobacterium sp.]